MARLLDLGIAEYLIASSLSGVLAQRLVRKLCECKKYEAPTTAFVRRLDLAGCAQVLDRVAIPSGCPLCDRTGYKGRIGIYELLIVDAPVRSILRGGFKPDLLRNAAKAAGMGRMQEDAFEKLQLGMTTLDEILRVVPVDNAAPAVCAGCGQDLFPAYRFCPYCGVRRMDGTQEQSTKSSQPITDGVLS